MANQLVSNGKIVQDCVAVGATSSGITRERSFIRTPQQSHQNKRRSLALAAHSTQHDKAKPAIEIYRPPSKLNRTIPLQYVFVLNVCFDIFVDIRSDVGPTQNKLNIQLNANAPEFTVNRNEMPVGYFSPNAQYLHHSKSSGNIQQQMQIAAARRHAVQMANLSTPQWLQLQQISHLQSSSSVSSL